MELTKEHAEILAKARWILEERTKYRHADRISDLYIDGHSAGYIAHAAKAAEEGIFDFLNCAASHMHDEVAEEFVHTRIPC